jgi:hypothetical protein
MLYAAVKIHRQVSCWKVFVVKGQNGSSIPTTQSVSLKISVVTDAVAAAAWVRGNKKVHFTYST